MSPDNSPEQPPKNVNQESAAAQAAREIITKIRAADTSGASAKEIEQQKDDIASDTIKEYLRSQERLKRLKEAEKAGTPETDSAEKIQKEQKNLGLSLIKACALADNDIQVVQNPIANRILRELSKTSLTDTAAVAIEENLGDYLLGNKTQSIIISKPGEARSNFMKGVDGLIRQDISAADRLVNALVLRAIDFDLTPEEMVRSFVPSSTEQQGDILHNQQDQRYDRFSNNPIANQEMIDSGLNQDMMYYQPRFSQDQLELVKTFYSPTAFVEHMEELGKKTSEGKVDPEGVRREKEEIREHIKDHFEKKPPVLKPGETLEDRIKTETEKHWGEKVSERMRWEISELVNHLFLVLQTESPHKFYDEIMQSMDPFYGPVAISNKIKNAISHLMTDTAKIERLGQENEDSPMYQKLKKIKPYLYIEQEQDAYIDERDKKLYPRLKPIPIGENVWTSKFIENIGMTLTHTMHRDSYFLNARALYGHAAGEKGFFQQLGDFADGNLKGTDIDEILMLPDGQYVLEAYFMYEKYLEDDFGSLDQRHRPDQFQPQIESVNSKTEKEIIAQLQSFYPELTDMRIRSIVNSAVGVSKGLTVTEVEKSAYADAVDADGNGMVASYSTIDAQSLNVLNILHNALRWQGEHNWNLCYFMPVDGEGGFWKTYNHNQSKDNMAKYMETFKSGKGRDMKKLPRLFVDAMMDINKTGSPQGKRKGWRDSYAFDGHFIFLQDENGRMTNKINPFETFKAMEAIGYEAVATFIDNKKSGAEILKATSGDLVRERKQFFKYIYSRYIYEGDDPSKCPDSELDSYLEKLQITGEERAIENIKNNHISSIGDASWEEQVTYETSQLFMESALAHYVGARMPTKILRICKNRFAEEGKVGRREQTYRDLHEQEGWDRTEFTKIMKNLETAEMLLRRKISGELREEMSFDKDFGLNQSDGIKNLPHKLTEKNIRELLSKNNKGGVFKSAEEIDKVVKLWNHIKGGYLEKGSDGKIYADEKMYKEIKDYPFSFGLEDTDMSLVAYRGTGPRMVARAVKDTASLEQTCTPWLMNMPNVLIEIAVDGKHDMSPIITYLRQAQKAIFDVHGSEAAQQFVYEVSGSIINYFKKDTSARGILGLWGLRRLGKANSNAAEYSGRSTATWEWDARDIDRYITALESYRLLPKDPYDKNKTEINPKTGKVEHAAGKSESVWWINPITKKPFKTIFTQKHIDFEIGGQKYNGDRLRKAHGADKKAIIFEYLNELLPIALVFLLWKYITDTLDEISGKKK